MSLKGQMARACLRLSCWRWGSPRVRALACILARLCCYPADLNLKAGWKASPFTQLGCVEAWATKCSLKGRLKLCPWLGHLISLRSLSLPGLW